MTTTPAIHAAAQAAGLAPALVEALCRVESSLNPWAWNPEPAYRYLWDVRRRRPFRALTAAELVSEVPPVDFPTLAGDRDQEWWGQQASWGLMQVMGAVAREQGFDGPYLPALCQVEVNLEVGCRHLSGLLRWAKGDVEAALAAYNGGRAGNAPGRPLRNASYARKVMATLAETRRA